MQQVIQAALATADPSPQDRAVAAQATALEQQARQEQSHQQNSDFISQQTNNNPAITSASQKSKATNAFGVGRPQSGVPESLIVTQFVGATQTPSTDVVQGVSVYGRNVKDTVTVQPAMPDKRSSTAEDALIGFVARVSQKVYSDPSIAGLSETSVQNSVAPQKNDARTAAITPSMITKFHPSKQISFYA
jgi:hypothetical protein